jgi:hypothetical protein
MVRRFGETLSACGKQCNTQIDHKSNHFKFITRTQKMSWAAARQYCCQVGMDLLSFESVKKIAYFNNLAISKLFISNRFEVEDSSFFIF